jgi:single-strand DNA-binding protein
VAVNRSVKNGDQWKEEASFFDVTYFGKRAEAVNQYLVKGKQVGIEGELRQERWNDKNTGQPRSKVGIVAANVQLLGSNSAPAQKPAVQNNRNKVDADGNSVMETEDTFTDDIPF